MRISLRERTKSGEDLKILATSELRDVEMLRGYMKEHCRKNSAVNPAAVEEMLTRKWDLPRLYFTALGTMKSGMAATRRTTNGKPLRGFAIVTIMRERNGTTKAHLELACSNVGAGTALVNAVVTVSRAIGLDSVQLATAEVSLIEYYKKFGFARVPDACDATYLGPDGAPQPLNSFAYVKGKKPSAAHQYVRSRHGWKGLIDGGASRRTTPVRRHIDGATDGYLMSRCLAPTKSYRINEHGEVEWRSNKKKPRVI